MLRIGHSAKKISCSRRQDHAKEILQQNTETQVLLLLLDKTLFEICIVLNAYQMDTMVQFLADALAFVEVRCTRSI